MRKIVLFFTMMLVFFSCSNDKLIEDVVAKYDDGSKKEVHYYKVNKDGTTTWVRETWFYQEGMKYLDGPIVDGKRNGFFESYHKSGNLMSTGEFVDGKRVGKAVVYRENGNIIYEGNYDNGRECGIWKFYDEDGNFKYEVNKD